MKIYTCDITYLYLFFLNHIYYYYLLKIIMKYIRDHLTFKSSASLSYFYEAQHKSACLTKQWSNVKSILQLIINLVTICNIFN